MSIKSQMVKKTAHFRPVLPLYVVSLVSMQDASQMAGRRRTWS